MRYLIARGPDGQGMVGGARTLREAKAIAEEIARRDPSVYIIDGRSGKVRRVTVRRTTTITTKGRA